MSRDVHAKNVYLEFARKALVLVSGVLIVYLIFLLVASRVRSR